MSTVELEHPVSRQDEQIQYIDVKDGHIVVQPVPGELTPATTPDRHSEKEFNMTSADDLYVEVTDAKARELAATLSLEEQVRVASFVRSVRRAWTPPHPSSDTCEWIVFACK